METVKLPSNARIAAVSGAFLVVAGVALMLAIAFGGRSDVSMLTASQQGGRAEAAAGETSFTEGAAAEFVADPSAPALAVGPDGTPEPYWRLKQREARERLLRSAGETGSVGVQSTGGGSATRAFPAGSTAGTTAGTTAGPVTREVATGGRTPLTGVWGGTPEQLKTYLMASNPQPRFTVPPLTLARYYVRYAAEVHLRADILWAQMLHETGFGAYSGSMRASQNNYAGIGATGGGEPGVTFPTAEDGVKAHIAHLVAYVFTDDRASWTDGSVDPRYDAVSPRAVAKVLSDLDGRWAVPGAGYGAAIERIVAAINH